MTNGSWEGGVEAVHQFDWMEYVVFFGVLGLSLLIGLYFGCYRDQKTVSDYLFGGKNMSVFPIAMSLVSSYISGITLLGMPTEIYTFGGQYALGILCNFVICFITWIFFLPVFYKLQLFSLYEYLEMRFNHAVRVVASLLYTITLLLYIPLVIYGPALAFNQVSGMNVHLVSVILCIVCILYTTLGGLKAVVWTDTLQGAMMMVTVFVVLTLGVFRAGGVYKIFEVAQKGDRLHVFNMNPDPTERLTFWTSTIGFTITYVSYTAINPSCVQRFIALPTYRQAKLSVVLLSIGIAMFAFPSVFIGLIMYAVYKDCDPLTSKAIVRDDQILPYFVLDVAGHLKGLPGLFVVGICCAALSTLSTSLNTVAGILFQDFVEPCMGGKVPDEKANKIIKALVVVCGAVCVAMVSVVEKLGRLVELSSAFGGMTSGSSLGIFSLGLFFPSANTKGALIGGLVSMCLMIWIMVGRQMALAKKLIPIITRPISVAGCTGTLSNFTSISSPRQTVEGNVEEVWWPYRISIFYYTFVGCSVVIIVGLAVTYITGPQKDVNPDLISPIFRRFIPKHNYQQVPLKTGQAPKESAP